MLLNSLSVKCLLNTANILTQAQIQYSAKSEIFVFPETSDKFSRSHVI
ncbi:Uncharacterised protein [Salmonella enterica subsp. arizonae]|nr:Uncharacterised protein [Salmonella enterica subsp. arizonae]SUG41425.1 Uncharacterised protein [Salmonella enterica subsp. arizonae]